MKRKSALLARFTAATAPPSKRPRATQAPLVYGPMAIAPPPPLPSPHPPQQQQQQLQQQAQAPASTSSNVASTPTSTPPAAVPEAAVLSAIPPAVATASGAVAASPPKVCLVRPPVVPGAAPMRDGARADAAERGFYAAWGLAPRHRAGDPARRQPLHRRNPGPNPISVSLAVLRDLNPDEYVVAEKTDGVRYALLLCGDEAGRPMAVMIDRAGRKFEVAVRAAARFFGGAGTLFDGELAWERAAPQTEPGAAARPLTVDRLVEVPKEEEGGGGDGTDNSKPPTREAVDVRGGGDAGPTTAHRVAAGRAPTTTTTAPDTLVYWVFDAVCVAGVSQRDADYETRIELVQRLLLQGRDADELVEAAPGANAHGLEFRPKPCVAARLVDSVWSGDAPRLRHGSDGLVLTPLRDPIRTGTHWRQFKWKYKHTFDLQLRGRRRPDGTWLWGLYYLEADWTVPTADALARAARPAPPASEPPAAAAAPADAPVARYLNACEGITYRRSDVARASLDRASAAAQRGRSRGVGAASSRAPASTMRTTTMAAGDDAECLVVFVLQKDAALDALVERVLAARPDARSIKCVVECEGAFVAPPAGWTPPAHAPPGGVRLLRCAIERLRTDKTDPNVRYTVRQTILNIDESITYATVRAALCRPRGPVL